MNNQLTLKQAKAWLKDHHGNSGNPKFINLSGNRIGIQNGGSWKGIIDLQSGEYYHAKQQYSLEIDIITAAECDRLIAAALESEE